MSKAWDHMTLRHVLNLERLTGYGVTLGENWRIEKIPWFMLGLQLLRGLLALCYDIDTNFALMGFRWSPHGLRGINANFLSLKCVALTSSCKHTLFLIT